MIQRPFNKLHGSASLPFVIPSEAEGSAVRPGSLTKVCVSLVLTQTLKPSLAPALCGTAEAVPIVISFLCVDDLPTSDCVANF